nr:C10 family peptidase [uncultured Draconibacterium sp.]
MNKFNLKRLFSLASIIALLAFINACNQLDMDDTISSPDMATKSASFEGIDYNVSLKSAKYLVQSTEGGKHIESIEPFVVNEDTLMFIFNFNEGWQVVSGDKRTDPILASDTTGQLSIAELENPGVATWLSDIADQILLLKKNNPEVAYDDGIEAWVLIDKAAHFSEDSLQAYRKKYNAIYESPDNTPQLKSLQIIEPGDDYQWVRRLVSVTSTPWVTSAQKGPLLHTKWGQGAPWNTDVPLGLKDGTWIKCPTGCTAVAMAQVIYNMHYKINKPTGLYHTVSCTGYVWDSDNYNVSFSRGNYVSNSERWDLMPTHRQGFPPNYVTPNSSYVGDLMADVGNRVGMTYGATGSGAHASKSGFNYYSIACDEGDYSYSTVYSNLQSNTPVLLSAYAKKEKKGVWPFRRTVYSEGHTWVIDGYRKKQKTYTYTYEWELVQGYSGSNSADDPYVYSTNQLLPPIDDIYPGKREIETRTTTSTYLLMNWGWNGSYDSGEYSTSSSAIWSSQKDYQYIKKIFFNFK